MGSKRNHAGHAVSSLYVRRYQNWIEN